MKRLMMVSALMLSSAGAFASDGSCMAVGSVANASFNWNTVNYVLCELPSSITTDKTLFNGNDVMYQKPVLWALPGAVTVGDGYKYGKTPATANDAELTIEAGVNIIATASNASLIISRGATINAVGTASDPIVFSSEDENFTGEGEWGGVILSGFGVANECNSGSDDCLMEGISDDYYFGGSLSDTIGSGTLQYVVITEGGSEINVNDPDDVANGGDEINGLTLYAVNDTNTTIDHVHVNENFDDGVEFFGGDVDVTDLWLTCNGDDSIDWDYGFTGSVTGVYIKQNGNTSSNASDHAMELAGNPNDSTKTPLANGTISEAYIEFVGSGVAYVDVPFKLKEGTGGNFSDMYLTGFAGKNCSATSSTNISSGDFNNITYDCTDAEGILPLSGGATVTSYPASFWNDAPDCD
ncbi:MAG: hypothetical protein CMI02_08405 [Oceanospirillaceae bacterium]|nr:hypothetical protein [Oceanospirillaceae bacterium]MBT12043.1 hypothetical protein [Oceanospirillaceae bacterium]|tara:strand:- start:71725 stop:72957 length:1233 start_codon:yes stop_codon:yes gene_type:complete